MQWRELMRAYTWLSLLMFLCSSTEVAAKLLGPTSHHPLTRRQNSGTFALQSMASWTDQAWSAQGKLLKATQEFATYQLTMHLDYGWTDRLSMAIDLPLAYRREANLLNADDFGLGDVTVDLLYALWLGDNSGLAVDLGIKLPTGDSDVQFLNTPSQTDAELPLGSGQHDLSLALQGHQSYSWLAAKIESAWVWRLPDRVLYAQALLPTTSTAIGNLEVDFGEEWRNMLWLDAKLPANVTLGVVGAYRMVFAGSVESFTLTATTSTRQHLPLGSGHELTLAPRLVWEYAKQTFGATLTVPILGESLPVSPLTDSLIGLTYALGWSYAF